MAEIKLEHITKRFGDVVAVDDVNLEIHDQEFVVFLGPSGCGKTTTLRAVAGLEHPDEGDIFIDGQRVNTLSPADRDIAFVFQFYALYPHLTVYDNIAFPLKAVKASKSEIQERVKEGSNHPTNSGDARSEAESSERWRNAACCLGTGDGPQPQGVLDG